MPINKGTIKYIVSAILMISFVFCLGPNLIWAQEADLDELNQEIQKSKEKLEDIKKQAAIYQKNIRLKQEEALSLQNQLEILNNKIAKTELDIEATEEEIKKTELEVRETELQILEQEEDIDNKQSDLGGTLKQIQLNSDTNFLEIFVLNNSISDFFNHVENTKLLSHNLNNSLIKVKLLKQQLVEKKKDLDQKREELVKLEKQLQLERAELQGEINYKDDLLVETKESEDTFYNLYWQAKREQENASAEIYTLEKQARAALDQNKADQPELTDSTLIWPVPKNTITATFHDPSYPFRHIFEHPGIDIRVGQGTSLSAAADGYVLKAKDNGMGYSYIALIHADGLSTVYGHVSKIYVKTDEYVSKGEIIGLTGGMPGTPGAGNLSTGPHLHFEVRLNGIPVDPQLYLP
jgi:murein DD-endopeptidase MepM/ murein hydrolase activator NlpD